ncbi:DUF4286 family protein [Aquimarina intermedia]|uniref:Uncharacterized protein DUF4286 n=1 Tax=Aquimarina intermedia TaxID=350814 RepID=A0A5S5CCT7_9FLAO|nr:DUF4286 family protein [Aquimarina intermedia]TYP76146.1 uncharacterized protein DUF4286 [Aquimarina intermedia]
MHIYNVTINIEESIQEAWLAWMQDTHIPEMLATGKFQNALMTKVLVEEDMGGITYSVQYTTVDKDALQRYYTEDAERLRATTNRFAGKMVAFRTELEIINQQTKP